jgi:hypothetical protein
MEMETDTTSPVDGGDTSEEIAEVEAEVETEGQEPELVEDGNPIEEPDEDEELELDDDLKLKVPKSQAQKVREAMLRQADYTKKTQELADRRKAFEAEQQQLSSATQAELNTYAVAQSVAAQIQQFQNVDWDKWHDTDPFEAAKASSQYQRLIVTHQQAMGQLQHLRGQRLSHAQQETAKRIEEGRTNLAKDIPGWNDDLKAKLIGFAAEHGFSQDELSDLEADPRVAKVLHAAFEGSQAKRKAAATNRHLQAQKVEPAATVGAKAIPPRGLSDKLSTEEWMRRRDEQARKRA